MVKELPVVYLQTAACSGCAVTMLNTASPTIKNVLIDQIARRNSVSQGAILPLADEPGALGQVEIAL